MSRSSSRCDLIEVQPHSQYKHGNDQVFRSSSAATSLKQRNVGDFLGGRYRSSRLISATLLKPDRQQRAGMA
jgi:hypothetical protein